MAIDSAKSTTTLLTQAIKNRYYIKRFLYTATPKLQHKQLGQLDQQIEKGEGGYGTGVVYWTRFTNLDLVTAGQGEGVPTTAVALTAVNVTGSTAQYDAAVSISDLLVYTSFGDMMKMAVERLGENAGKSIDTLVRNSISEYLTSQIATGAAHITAIPSTGTLSITEIRKAKRTLSRNDALDVGGFWVAVVHPDALYDLLIMSWRSLVEILIKKFREFGKHLFKTIPSQVLNFLRKGVETMYETTILQVDEIVRTMERSIEISRNVLFAL